jgi:chaperonin GroES
MKTFWRVYIMEIKVQGDLVLVKVVEESEVRPSGLILANINEEPSQLGIIVALGDGVRYEDIVLEDGQVKRIVKKRPIYGVNVGDKIIFPKWAGEKVEIGEEEYLFIREAHMLAVVEEVS